MVVEDLNLSTKIGFNPTQKQIQEQIRQLPKIKPEKAVVLEFEDVAPRWNKFIQDAIQKTKNIVGLHERNSTFWKELTNTEEGIELDISAHKFCLVGEAHGFNDEYLNAGKDPCSKCCTFAIYAIRARSSPRRMITFQEKFMKHYNEAHL